MRRPRALPAATRSILSLLAVALLSHCNDSGTMATTSPDTDTNGCVALDGVSYLAGSQADCCCSGGVAINPAPTSCSQGSFNCPQGTAGVSDTAGSLNDMANATNSGEGDLGTANTMLGSNPGAQGGAAANTSAALAGPLTNTGASTSNSLANTPANSLAQVAPGSGSATGTLGGGGLGSSGNTASVGGSGSGASGLSGNSTGVAGAVSTPAAVGAYTTPSGSMASGSADSLLGGASQLGADGADDAANGTSQSGNALTKFAGNRALAAAGGTMGSADPADYFSRLQISDNIFKIVERRYIAKSRQWALADAAAVANSTTKKR